MIKHNWTQRVGDGWLRCPRCGCISFEKEIEDAPAGRCQRNELTKVQLQRLQIGSRYWEAELEDLEHVPHGKLVHRYCHRIHAFKEEGQGLFLFGANGVGKSFALAVLLKEAVRCGYTAMLMAPAQYMDGRIEKARFDDEQSLVERAETVAFLGLDDVGKEHSSGSGWAEKNLERLLRVRSQDMLVTHMTTNLAERQFGDRYGMSVRSLALEMLHPVNVKGTDFRAKSGSRARELLK